ncbi:MAG: hypothetical protein RJA35_755 [Actinomycetota bacterium]
MADKVLRALGIAAGLIGVFYLMVFLSFLGASGHSDSSGHSGQAHQTTAKPQDNRVRIVTSVQVWADIAQAIGGKYVHATAIIARPNQDPHSYEATVRDQLAVNRAALTIENGADYDPFFHRLVESKPNANQRLTLRLANALPQQGGEVNPHFWYDLKITSLLVKDIAKREIFAVSNPAAKIYIRTRAEAYQMKLDELVSRQESATIHTSGKSAILTEGFAAYLLRNLRMVDRTPTAFVNAVEQEQDAAPAVMRTLQLMIAGHRVNLLVSNQQTAGAQSQQLATWAKAAGVPQLELSELLPTGKTYLTWMASNLNKIEAALK